MPQARQAMGTVTQEGNGWGASPIQREDLVTYGDMVDMAYMTFAAEDEAYESTLSSLLAGIDDCRYVATAHLFATIEPVPKLLEALPVLRGLDKPYWFGYVAVARRGDCLDIVVAWRGSATLADWMMDIHADLVPFVDGAKGGVAGKVAEGFYKVYTCMDSMTERGKVSAKEQVVTEVARLVGHFRRGDSGGERQSVRVTVAGHSLGGALALMSAHDAAAALAAAGHADVPVRAVTFGAPRVGDQAFRGALRARGVDVVRVVVKQDVVPRLWMGPRYVDVGDHVVVLDEDKSPRKLTGHSLDLYLHLMTLRDTATYKFNVHQPTTQAPAPGDGAADAGQKEKKPRWKKMVEGDGYMRLPPAELDEELGNSQK
ncbi:phospholipase A1-Igamma1, chloroplastic-like [Oryza brachyantha]|uniref:phospholipase A1-Igamma1, chloroplastic-like n=1 Tax=Oryza brachyantha TaxID=4533 RepID=UPI001ADD3FBE|nr:phospholipase A1-Igamma1, chloroplastic-like [Oryza brachyantha]